MNAASKGVSLGIYGPEANKIEVGPSQPFVDILGRKVRICTPSLFSHATTLTILRVPGTLAGAGPFDAERRVACNLERTRRRSEQGIRVHARCFQAATRSRYWYELRRIDCWSLGR